MKNLIRKLGCLILALTLILSIVGCGNSLNTGGKSKGKGKVSAEYDYDKVYGGYDKPITVKIGVVQRDTEADYQNNAFVRILKDKFNINVEFEWVLPWEQHMEKLTMSINAGTIPDAAMIYSANSVKSLLETDSIYDINKLWDYVSPEIKEIYASYSNNECLEDVSYNGKLGALPSTSVSYQHELLWVRKDWLDTLGLSEPKTLDDVINVAKAFVTKDPDQNGRDDTYGIPFSSYLFGVDNTSGTIDPLFAAFGSYPGAWLKDENGNVAYGSTQPETKKALTKLAELFQSRVIFCTEDNSGNKIGAGKCGMIFAPWYAGDILKASFENNPDVDWIALSAPLNSDGKYTVPAPQAALDVNGHMIIGKNAEHPEAIIKMKNIFAELQRCITIEDYDSVLPDDIVSTYKSYVEEDGTDEVPNLFWQQVASKKAIIEGNIVLSKAVESDNTKGLTTIQLKQFENIQAWLDDPTGCEAEQWQDAVNLMIGTPAADSKAYKEIETAVSVLPNEFTTTYSNIQKTEQSFFYDIIAGIKTPDAFENFVANFKSMGGDEILEALNK